MHNPVVQTLNYLNLCVLFFFVLPVLKNYVWIQSSHVWDDLDIYQFTIWGYFCMYFHVSQAMHIGPFGWFWCTLAAAQGETGGLEVMVPFINDPCFQLQGLVTLKPHPSVLYRDVICTLSTCQWSCGSSEWYHTHEHTSHELNNDNMIWSYIFGHNPPGIGRIIQIPVVTCGPCFPHGFQVFCSPCISLCAATGWRPRPPNTVCGVNGVDA